MTYPLLSTPDLVQAMQGIGLQITSDAIDQPSTAKVIPLYVWFLSEKTQLNLEDISVASQAQLDIMDDQEIFKEAIYQGTLFETLDQIMKLACIEDFTFRDIRDPRPTRVRKILSALINFHLFEAEQLDVLAALEEQAEDVVRTEQDLIKRKAAMQAAAARREAALDEQRAQAAELEALNNDLKKQLYEIRVQAKAKEGELSENKKRRDKTQEAQQRVMRLVAEHQAEATRLRTRIVQSPKRVKRTLKDLTASLAQTKAQITAYELKKRDHLGRCAALKRYEADLSSVIKLADEWATEAEEAEEASLALEAVMQAKERGDERSKELNLRLSQMQRRIGGTREQLERQGKIAEDNRNKMRKQMASLQQTYEGLLKDRQTADLETASVQKAVNVKEAEINELVRSSNDDTMQSEAFYSELRDELFAYGARLHKALDQIGAYCAK
ncbi:uncharacterized protein L969DRAFT_84721 [Mixia osmundae IAM 14324]|uniref:Uncharacterized protein n=1 Tax=Mixia osmundae (strain CBS 9802 / IAM 14324 / JCM 22182 / KY 12970) TaxID=764103 RepID=G7DTI5_MIXOS|nr:uncharacterized protein L969DRAFT_84721 [Mixia osmundae IAM 14324]KEI42831.1 hypothetical protein L969DRAFT_84721 [Mixia osmundae IAM 14324]GAA93832.1 hypothetical protein E5Q_00478 [Mixia osmundae IAM 14324]